MISSNALIPFSVAALAVAVILTPVPAGAIDRAVDAVAGAFETAALEPGQPGAEATVTLPPILSSDDIDRYREIFRLQVDGRWNEADALIATLGDRLLMGHVMAQRYLHPTKYRSKYVELKDWMADYADHPDARRIYKLALRRQPKNWRSPKPPIVGTVQTAAPVSRGPVYKSDRKRSSADTRKVRQYERTIRSHLSNGWTLAAKKLLWSEEVKRLFNSLEYDRARASLGARYFIDGRDEWALEWAGGAAARSGRFLSEAHWAAGLAAWRLGRLDEALVHFGAIGEMDYTSPWMISAGAFWAARVSLVDRRPRDVNRWLGLAARHPRTFYGLLAGRMLGLDPGFQWLSPRLEAEAVHSLTVTAGGRRALALIQVGELGRAERDLFGISAGADRQFVEGMLALASFANFPYLAMKLEGRLYPNGDGYDNAAFPLPSWVPEGGYSVDRALIYAVIRQESKFNPNAKSPAGARGVMQIMPRTASFVANDRSLRGSGRDALYRPEFSIELGQKYIQMLLGDAAIGGSMFPMAVAWNGGPGNLSKWRRQIDSMDDPLFFIESLPSKETRIFIERVFANLWIYRHRLGQPAPSLDSVAAGEWPMYKAVDGDQLVVAGDGEDRR